jgi:rubrerythrin
MGLFDFFKKKQAPVRAADAHPREIDTVDRNRAAPAASDAPPPVSKEEPLDQEALAAIAIHDPNWVASEKAAKQLTDQSLLAKVATTAGEELARIVAVYKLEDAALLAQIAQSDKDAGVRKAAARMLTQRSPVSADEAQRIRSAAGRVDGLLLRCGGCGSQERAQLEVVLDKNGSRGILCEPCVREYLPLLRTGSDRRFWQCGNCTFRILAGTRMDAAVDPDSRCPNCRADVNVSLVNLSNDQPVASGAIGEPLA